MRSGLTKRYERLRSASPKGDRSVIEHAGGVRTGLQVWRRRRHLEWVARWEQTRLQGKIRFIIRGWIVWSAGLILVTSVYDYYSVGHLSLLKILCYFLAGPIVAGVAWWSSESEYRAAKIDERRRTENQSACQ